MNWEKFNIFNFSDRKFLWTFVIAAVIFYLPLLIWNEWPQRDVAGRYAPMAEAFARGDFKYAFHPRCQMMLPLCAGIVRTLTGVGGLMACKISALIFFILAVFPLFDLAKTVFNRRIAIGAATLYLFCFHIIEEMVVTGVRDALKIFFLMWMTRQLLMVVRERDVLRHYLGLGAACGLSACVRAEMFFIALAVLFISGVLDGLKHRWMGRFSAGLLCAAAGLSIEVLVNWAVCGYAVPCSRFITLFRQYLHTDPTLGKFYLYALLPMFPLYLALCRITVFMLTDPRRKKLLAALTAVAAVVLVVYIVRNTTVKVSGLAKFFRGIHNGLTPVFYPPAILGILTVLWQRRWTNAQWWLAALFLLFNGLVIGQVIFHDRYYYVAARYLMPAAPLLLPWSAIGIWTLWQLVIFSRVPHPRAVAGMAVGVAIALSLYLSYRTEILNHCRRKEINDWKTIHELVGQFSGIRKTFCRPAVDPACCKSNERPLICADKIGYYSIAPYVGGFSCAGDPAEADFLIVPADLNQTWVRRYFGVKRPVRKFRRPIKSRRGDIQIWQVVR